LESAMRAIVEDLLRSPVPVAVYVSPEGARAASAGMFIALSADITAMAPATHIGAAHPVAFGGELDETSAEKLVSDSAALVRAIAARRARNVTWAERAVRESASLTAAEAVEAGVVDLIAADQDDLLRRIDSLRLERPDGAHWPAAAGLRLVPFGMSLFERMMQVISDPNIAYLLLTLGTLFLLAELAQPGLSLAGIGSAVCYILALMSLGSLPINWAGVALLAAAVVFFVVGLLTDTEAVVTVAGLVPFVLGSLLLFSPFRVVSPAAPRLSVSPWLIGAVALVFGFVVVVVLRAVLRARRLPPQSGAESLVGAEALALTDLDPSGQIRVNQQEWSAIAQGPRVSAGQRVVVTGYSGVHLLVKVSEQQSEIGGN